MEFNHPDPHKDKPKPSVKLLRQRSKSNPENEFPIQSLSREWPDALMNNDGQQPQNSPPHENHREERKIEEPNGELTERQTNPPQRIDIRCLNEDLRNIKNLKFLPRGSARNPTNEDRVDNGMQERQMKDILQHFMDLLPWEFQNMQESATTKRNDVKNYLESIYRKRKVPKTPVRKLDPSEPCMKLKVLKTSFEKNSVIEYYVTPRGMLNSHRNTDHDDIIIGRQQAAEDGVVPNDICLFYSETAISRVHARIITKYGFNTMRDIPENFVAFLMMCHRRLGVNSPGYMLSENLCRHIFSFIKEPKKFWIVDLGSSFGTYLKLNSESLHALEKGQTYLVGKDTYFNIAEVKNVKSKKQSQLNLSGEYKEETRGDHEEFLKFLFQERVYNKCEIHGMTEIEENLLEGMIANHKELLYEEDANYIETERTPPCFQRPYLKLEVQNYGGLHSTPNHIFIGNPKKEFVIGRSQECDINLIQKTAISRKQCRFELIDGVWHIGDGMQDKRSANGTWVSLTDYRLKREKIESEPREIRNGSEIKINDTVVQVEIFNNS